MAVPQGTGVRTDTIAPSAGQAVFSFQFPLLDASFLDVYVDGVLQTGGYAVAYTPGDASGTVSFGTAISSGQVTMYNGQPTGTSTVGFYQSGLMPALSVDWINDYVAYSVLALQEQLDRAITLPITSTGGTPTFPVPPGTAGAGKLIAWDSLGAGLMSASVTFDTDPAGGTGGQYYMYVNGVKVSDSLRGPEPTIGFGTGGDYDRLTIDGVVNTAGPHIQPTWGTGVNADVVYLNGTAGVHLLPTIGYGTGANADKIILGASGGTGVTSGHMAPSASFADDKYLVVTNADGTSVTSGDLTTGNTYGNTIGAIVDGVTYGNTYGNTFGNTFGNTYGNTQQASPWEIAADTDGNAILVSKAAMGSSYHTVWQIFEAGGFNFVASHLNAMIKVVHGSDDLLIIGTDGHTFGNVNAGLTTAHTMGNPTGTVFLGDAAGITAGDASRLGGIVPAGYLGSGGTAVDSSKLGGVVPAGYLGSGGTAVDSTKLGGVVAAGYLTTGGDGSGLSGVDAATLQGLAASAFASVGDGVTSVNGSGGDIAGVLFSDGDGSGLSNVNAAKIKGVSVDTPSVDLQMAVYSSVGGGVIGWMDQTVYKVVAGTGGLSVGTSGSTYSVSLDTTGFQPAGNYQTAGTYVGAVAASSGIAVSMSGSTATITNTGILSVGAGTGMTVTGSDGNIVVGMENSNSTAVWNANKLAGTSVGDAVIGRTTGWVLTLAKSGSNFYWQEAAPTGGSGMTSGDSSGHILKSDSAGNAVAAVAGQDYVPTSGGVIASNGLTVGTGTAPEVQGAASGGMWVMGSGGWALRSGSSATYALTLGGHENRTAYLSANLGVWQITSDWFINIQYGQTGYVSFHSADCTGVHVGFGRSMGYKTRAISSTQAADASDYVVFVDATSAAVTYGLPSGTASGRVLIVKKVDTSGNSVTAMNTSGQLVDGSSAGVVLAAQNDYAVFISRGTTEGWYVIGRNPSAQTGAGVSEWQPTTGYALGTLAYPSAGGSLNVVIDAGTSGTSVTFGSGVGDTAGDYIGQGNSWVAQEGHSAGYGITYDNAGTYFAWQAQGDGSPFDCYNGKTSPDFGTSTLAGDLRVDTAGHGTWPGTGQAVSQNDTIWVQSVERVYQANATGTTNTDGEPTWGSDSVVDNDITWNWQRHQTWKNMGIVSDIQVIWKRIV